MPSATPVASVITFVCASALGAIGSYLYKSGADDVDGTLGGYLANPRLPAGVLCYIAVMVQRNTRGRD